MLLVLLLRGEEGTTFVGEGRYHRVFKCLPAESSSWYSGAGLLRTWLLSLSNRGRCVLTGLSSNVGDSLCGKVGAEGLADVFCSEVGDRQLTAALCIKVGDGRMTALCGKVGDDCLSPLLLCGEIRDEGLASGLCRKVGDG